LANLSIKDITQKTFRVTKKYVDTMVEAVDVAKQNKLTYEDDVEEFKRFTTAEAETVTPMGVSELCSVASLNLEEGKTYNVRTLINTDMPMNISEDLTKNIRTNGKMLIEFIATAVKDEEVSEELGQEIIYLYYDSNDCAYDIIIYDKVILQIDEETGNESTIYSPDHATISIPYVADYLEIGLRKPIREELSNDFLKTYKFVTQEDKDNWNNKQDKIKNGVFIRQTPPPDTYGYDEVNLVINILENGLYMATSELSFYNETTLLEGGAELNNGKKECNFHVYEGHLFRYTKIEYSTEYCYIENLTTGITCCLDVNGGITGIYANNGFMYLDDVEKYVDDVIGDVSYAEVSDTVPTNEKVNVWINPTASEEMDIVALNDETIDEDSTWSSSKIDTELKNINNSLSKEISNIERNQYNILESAGLIGREETIITDLSSYNPTLGFITNTGTWSNINEKYQFIVIPISNTGSTLSITANDSCATYFAGLRSYIAPTDKITVDLSEADGWTSRLTVPKSATKQYNIPDDVKYLILFVVYNTSDCTPASFYLNIPYGRGRVDILEEKVDILENGHKLKWLALGDSITEGYYSVLDENTEDTESHKSIDECYCAWIAKMKGFDLDNKGVGGSGWLKRGTAAAPKLNSREQIDAVNKDGTHVIDFTKYDICTIMWGVNDWKGSQNLGTFEDGINPETESVYGNMRYVIETILTRNPNIKLIVITPVNCRQDTSARPSSADNNWGIGFEFGGHTLDDYYDAIKNVCEYYGIEMIDMTHNSVINRINAETMLPDKVHPSLDAHRQIGLELSGKILYGC
jgi:lysophospholipase L1-like esterase